ncbi:Mob1 phocein family protein [Rutstroemia sp. NJR-2017a BVV2]|nr:Mob1 phocein family protein [Rutstroemia sp. NJR-2017a BVV2]
MMSLPPSSPRLPSPPPPTEIQIGPKSPSLGSAASNQEQMVEQGIIESNAGRRIRPGTKAADMAAGPPLVPLSELDSAFQLQEHLKALHYHHTKPPNSDHTIPINRESATVIATPPSGLDQALWLYELCRFLINKCNDLIIGFLFDDPPCSASTCPEMRASEWQFLCAVHESPKSCCAIDYCCHTLDWATNIVTSQKIFPSRLSLGAGDAMDDRGAGVKHLINIFRRLHRIFAHAWFQHRGVFWQVEGQTGLYVLFKTVCDMHELLSPENYKLPPEAEGLESVAEEKAPLVTSIMKGGEGKGGLGATDDFLGVGRNNTRRHIRQSPSVGSAITTVQESDEEDPDVTSRLLDLGITTGERDEDNETEAEVPVIVESFEEVDENHDMETNGDGEHEAETHELEIGSDVSHPDEDTDTVIQIGSKADSTGSWDRMSGDSLGDKPETEEDERADDDDDRPVTVIGISKDSDSSDTKDGGDDEEEEEDDDDDEKEESPIRRLISNHNPNR